MVLPLVFTVGSNSAPYGICSGDFNHDGHIDLVTANNSSNNLSIIFGTGTGTFGTATTFGGGSNPRSVIKLDFNKDGNDDIAVAYFWGNNTWVYIGDGAGNFSSGPVFNVSGGSSEASLRYKC